MAAQVISLAQRLRAPAFRDWSRQELAEFYRVESALLQAGLDLETERGLSDEGDPWLVFCRVDTGEVFIHFARCDGWYVVDGAAMGAPSRGRDFGALVRDLIGRHPLSNARRPGSNVLMHPAALLIALVGAAFFHSGRAKAAEVAHHDGAAADASKDARRGVVLGGGGAPPASVGEGSRVVALDASEVAAVLTGVAIGLRELADASSAGAAQASDPLGTPYFLLAAPALRDAADRSGRGASAEMLGALSASQARAALTVMVVVHDLGRPSAIGGASAPATVMSTDAALRSDLPASPMTGGGGGGGGGPPTLLVHLAPGPLPQIEALAVVAADGALARVSPDRVVHVDQLPTFLADLVSHGDTVPGGNGGGGGGDVSGAGGAASQAADTSVAPVDHTTTVDDAHAHAAAKPAAVSEHAGAVVSTTTIASNEPSPPPPPTPAQSQTPAVLLTPQADHPAVAPAHPAYIDNAVLSFVTMVTNVQVVIAGHEVVFYDPQILSALAPGDTLDSITWRLEDGSSVSLVGTATEIHAFHSLG